MGEIVGFVASPRLIDVVLAFTCLEAALLLAWRIKPAVVAGVLVPGMCLMLAVRAVLAGAAWPWLPVALLGALAGHLLDLRIRLRR